MRKITYTKKLHVYRLELMLNKGELCSRCPAIPINQKWIDFHMYTYVDKHYLNNPCSVCLGFLGLRFNTQCINQICPCHHPKLDPIKISLKAIKDYKEEDIT